MKKESMVVAIALTGAVCVADVATPKTLWTQYAEVTNASGRTLKLAAGRYRLTRPMVFTRGIIVRGSADGETVLDGGDDLDRLVEIVHKGADTFVFERLTFTHAAKQALVKGHVRDSGLGSLIVRDCRFKDNGTKWDAGYGRAGRGLHVICANPVCGTTTLVERCVFEGNAYRPASKGGKGGKGGAVVVAGQRFARFADCTFRENGIAAPTEDGAPCLATVMSGSAAYVTDSPSEFVRCSFLGNISVSQVEGGWTYDAAALALENYQKAVSWNCFVTDCRFEGNYALAPSVWNRYSPTVGALFISDLSDSGSVSVKGCTFAGNRADTVSGSAGISVFGGNLVLRGTTFRHNAVADGGMGADLRLTGRFAQVAARPTHATVADCTFDSESDGKVFASGGAVLSLGKANAPNGILKVNDAALLARLPKFNLAGVREIVLGGMLATAGSEMPIRADGDLVVRGLRDAIIDGLGRGSPLTVEGNGTVVYKNLRFKDFGGVWPLRHGFGLTRFENCHADGAPGVETLWTVPACVETNRYIGWPTVCRRRNGELIAVFSGDRAAHVSKDGKVQAVRSKDGGLTWSAPETWVNSPVDDRDSGLVELPNGNLVLFYFSSVCYAGTGYTNDFVNRIGCDYKTAKAAVGAFCRRSTDGGKTWSRPTRLKGIAPHGACVTKDGRLVLVSRGQRAEGCMLENDPAWTTTTHKLYAEGSSDGGKSWSLLHTFAVPDGVDITKIHEPHVIEAADGSLVAQFRTSLFSGVLLQSVSADGGATWTPLAPTGLHGHPAHLIRLADGRLLTTYGRRSNESGGSGVYVAVSSDHGRTWGKELKVFGNAYNVFNFGYPATADLGNGDFLSVCYQQVEDDATPCLMAVRWRMR